MAVDTDCGKLGKSAMDLGAHDGVVDKHVFLASA
jgi:hypothetical protein